MRRRHEQVSRRKNSPGGSGELLASLSEMGKEVGRGRARS